MTFVLQPSARFVEQVRGLDEKGKRIVEQKLLAIKQNPFQFKPIHARNYKHVFRVRLHLKGIETRLIYVVLEPKIILVCLLERKKDYRDLEKHLDKI